MDIIQSAITSIIIGLAFLFLMLFIYFGFRRFVDTDKKEYDDYFKRLIPGIFGGIVMYVLIQVGNLFQGGYSFSDILLTLVFYVITILFIMLIGLFFFFGFKRK